MPLAVLPPSQIKPESLTPLSIPSSQVGHPYGRGNISLGGLCPSVAPTSYTRLLGVASRLTDVFRNTVSVFRLDNSDYTIPFATPGDETVIIRQTSVADLHGSSEAYFEHDNGTVVLPDFYENTARGIELQTILVESGYDIRYEEV